MLWQIVLGGLFVFEPLRGGGWSGSPIAYYIEGLPKMMF